MDKIESKIYFLALRKVLKFISFLQIMYLTNRIVLDKKKKKILLTFELYLINN